MEPMPTPRAPAMEDADTGAARAAMEPMPTPAPQGEPAMEPMPTPAPQGEPAMEPMPTPAPQGEPAMEPMPTPAPQGEPAMEPMPTPAPQGEPAMEPMPTPAHRRTKLRLVRKQKGAINCRWVQPMRPQGKSASQSALPSAFLRGPRSSGRYGTD